MKKNFFTNFLVIFCILICAPILFASIPVTEKNISDAFVNRTGACIFMNCSAEEVSQFNPKGVIEPLPPCSTFKIWNSLIGFETKKITSPDEPFYKWDGQIRQLKEWNKDLTFREAFKVSCVPAFQQLAEKIGLETMKKWIDTINYGDKDLSSGITEFWLPVKAKKSLLITPKQQAQLICNLINGKIPFSEKTRNFLKEVMLVKKTDKGTLYGKTGSAINLNGDPKQCLGWFVGYVEFNNNTYSFACVIKGEKLMGKDARAIIEKILEKSRVL